MESNEILVQRIQNGETTLKLQLWEQVRRFTAQQANRLYRKLGGRFGVDVEDLISSGFLALEAAVLTYHDEGYTFLTWYGYHLKNAFLEACGRRKRNILDECRSLDEPLDEEQEITLQDTLEDPEASAAFDCAEDSIYILQLRDALEAALGDLPEEQAATLRKVFFDGMSETAVAAATGEKKATIHKRKQQGLCAIRRGRHYPALREFCPFSGTGLRTWQHTGASVQERFVIWNE